MDTSNKVIWWWCVTFMKPVCKREFPCNACEHWGPFESEEDAQYFGESE